MTKTLPFTKEQIETLAREHPTPFYVYDEAGIRARTRALSEAFSWNKGFKQHFAVKALPNPVILAAMREEGSGADCSSLPELSLADKAGIKGENIMFSGNDTPAEEFIEAKKFAIDNEKGIWNHSGYYSCFNLKIKEKAISIKNNCKELNLKNWTLREEGRKKYNFQDISLGQITHHLLNGTDNQTALFWQSSPSAKNTFYLLDSQQRLVDYEINY